MANGARSLAIASMLIVLAIVGATVLLSFEKGQSGWAGLHMVLLIAGGPLALILLMMAGIAASLAKDPGATTTRTRPNWAVISVFLFGIMVCVAWKYHGYGMPPWLVVSSLLSLYVLAIVGIFRVTKQRTA